LTYSKEEISGDELDDTEETEEQEEEEEEKEELPGMLEDDSEQGFRPITTNPPRKNPPSHTVELEDQHFVIQNTEELDPVDGDFNNIALMEVEGANDSDVQAQKEDQADNAHVDW
jgi:hypothetical protein